MAGHRLVWLSNRNTPKVVSKGKRYKPKPSEGKIVKSRAANASEERTIAKGGWVRVDKKGRKPGSKKGYGTGSKIRPQFKYKKKKKSSSSSRSSRSSSKHRMTPKRKAALRRAQSASARKRRGKKK